MNITNESILRYTFNLFSSEKFRLISENLDQYTWENGLFKIEEVGFYEFEITKISYNSDIGGYDEFPINGIGNTLADVCRYLNESNIKDSDPIS